MRGFYDKMLPAAANKLGKKHGAQVGQAEMIEPEMKLSYEELQRRRSGESQFKPTVHTVHTLPITPSLREQCAAQGLPAVRHRRRHHDGCARRARPLC